MTVRACVLPVLALFVIAALFGTFVFMSPMHDEMRCPFAASQSVICAANVLTHLSHWQIAFASILVELLLLTALVLVFMSRREHLPVRSDQYHERIRTRAPARPTLIQELFSRGILNPKVF